jgi:hypothetical protein
VKPWLPLRLPVARCVSKDTRNVQRRERPCNEQRNGHATGIARQGVRSVAVQRGVQQARNRALQGLCGTQNPATTCPICSGD